MPTQTILYNLQIDFKYDIDEVSFKQAVENAVKLAIRPDFASILNSVRLEKVEISDPDCNAVLDQWLSADLYNDHFED